VRRLAFIGAWLVGAAGAAHAIQDCELDGAPINTSNGNTTAGKTGLIRCKDRDSGEVQREQQLQNGVFMGLVRYYEKGKLLKEHSVNAKGNMDGRAREFVPATGQMLRDAVYSDGSEVGLVRGIYPSGQLRRLSFASSEAGSSGERAYVEYTERGQLSALRCADKPVLAPVIDDSKLCGFASAGTPSQVELFDGKGTLRVRVSYAAGKRVRNENLYDNGKPQTQDEIVGNQRTERRFSSEGVKRTRRRQAARARVLGARLAGARPALDCCRRTIDRRQLLSEWAAAQQVGLRGDGRRTHCRHGAIP
jgi:antitoxin component YwqK of YwqJK toxin-antitoxin module